MTNALSPSEVLSLPCLPDTAARSLPPSFRDPLKSCPDSSGPPVQEQRAEAGHLGPRPQGRRGAVGPAAGGVVGEVGGTPGALRGVCACVRAFAGAASSTAGNAYGGCCGLWGGRWTGRDGWQTAGQAAVTFAPLARSRSRSRSAQGQPRSHLVLKWGLAPREVEVQPERLLRGPHAEHPGAAAQRRQRAGVQVLPQEQVQQLVGEGGKGAQACSPGVHRR